MDGQLLEQAAQKALERFLAQTPEERRVKMTSGEYNGLFDVISDMTLSDDDIEELTQADKYLGPAECEEDDKVSVAERPVFWDEFTPSTQVLASSPGPFFHFCKDTGEQGDGTSFSVETENKTYAIGQRSLWLHDVTDDTLLNHGRMEGVWQLNAQAA